MWMEKEILLFINVNATTGYDKLIAAQCTHKRELACPFIVTNKNYSQTHAYALAHAYTFDIPAQHTHSKKPPLGLKRRIKCLELAHSKHKWRH